jgi:uncharacterized membrane protein YqhA
MSRARELLRRGRWFLVPLVVALVLGVVLLAMTGGLAALSPFRYAVF